MKHQKTISDILASFHEPWMSDDDKSIMNRELLIEVGKTTEQLDAEIEVGVTNGYSSKEQLDISKEIISRLAPNEITQAPPASPENADGGCLPRPSSIYPINPYEVLGWAIGFFCSELDSGRDPRKIATPIIIHSFECSFADKLS